MAILLFIIFDIKLGEIKFSSDIFEISMAHSIYYQEKTHNLCNISYIKWILYEYFISQKNLFTRCITDKSSRISRVIDRNVLADNHLGICQGNLCRSLTEDPKKENRALHSIALETHAASITERISGLVSCIEMHARQIDMYIRMLRWGHSLDTYTHTYIKKHTCTDAHRYIHVHIYTYHLHVSNFRIVDRILVLNRVQSINGRYQVDVTKRMFDSRFLKFCFVSNAQVKNPQNPRFSDLLAALAFVFSYFEISEFLRSRGVEWLSATRNKNPSGFITQHAVVRHLQS